MDPLTITMSLLSIIVQQGFAHYINKILDKADKKILNSIGRTDKQPNLEKVKIYLEKNPEVVEKVEKEVNRFSIHSMVIPPSDAKLTHEDKLTLYASILNIVIDVMNKQNRDIILQGFFNSPDSIAIYKSTSLLKPVSVQDKRILLFPFIDDTFGMGPWEQRPTKDVRSPYYGFKIYLYNLHESIKLSISPDKINEEIRSIMKSSNQYVSLSSLKISNSLFDNRYIVNKICSNFLTFSHERYKMPLTPLSKIGYSYLDITNNLKGDELDFHIISDPYLGAEKMFESLVKEAKQIYVPEKEVIKIRNLIEKLKLVDIY